MFGQKKVSVGALTRGFIWSAAKCYLGYTCSVLGRVQSATWAILSLHLEGCKVLLGLYLGRS